MGSGEDIFLDRPKQEDEQRLREVVCERGSVGICCHDSPHGEAVDPPLRTFHIASEGEFSEVGLLTDSCWIHRCWLRCERGRALSRGSFPFPSGCSLPLPLFVHHPRRTQVL